MRNTVYGGPGVEIEEDVVRLRRRKLEYDGDAARAARLARRRWTLALARTLPTASGRRG